jgi:hypothetical protein
MLALWAERQAPSTAVIKARALERAEQHVRDGDRLIAQQKELMAKLLAIGPRHKRVRQHARPA